MIIINEISRSKEISKISIIAAMLMSFVLCETSFAGLYRKNFWDYPEQTPLINEDVVAWLCYESWGEYYNLFDQPIAMAMQLFGESNAGDYFALDRRQCKIKYFGTIINANNERELFYYRTYGNGAGSGTSQYKNPQSIVISLKGPSVHQNYLYVLDSGNNRIEEIRVDYDPLPPTLSHVGYLNLEQFGPMSNPHDIAYCELHDDYDVNNDFLVIADTYNHRVVAFKRDGTHLWTVGGTEPGSGTGDFAFPYAVAATQMNQINNEALIYVADRGNNRLVLLKQSNDFQVSWVKSIEFAKSREKISHYSLGEFSLSGLEDVVVDTNEFRTGVFLLDSRNNSVLHLDYKLNNVIQEMRNQFYFKSTPLHGLEIKRGELVVLTPYTISTGLELFEVAASIGDINASPDPLVQPTDRSTITVAVAGNGYLTLKIKQGAVTKRTLMDDYPVYPGLAYTIWDGRDSDGSIVANGTYQIVCELEDRYSGDIRSKSIDIKVESSENIVVLESHNYIAYPDWSPLDDKVVYSAQDATGNYVIASHDLSENTETILYSEEATKRKLFPSWSPCDTNKIAYMLEDEKPGTGLFRYIIYLLDLSGPITNLLSDYSGDPTYFVDMDPRWIPYSGGDEVSYLKARYNPDYDIDRYDLQGVNINTNEIRTIKQGIGKNTQTYVWSPQRYEIATLHQSYSPPRIDINLHQLLEGLERQINEKSDQVETQVGYGMDWTPDDRYIAFYQNVGTMDSLYWDVFILPAVGGQKISTKCVASEITGGSISSPYQGLTWSPEGTKFAMAIKTAIGGDVDLLAFDYPRNEKAFPAAKITFPHLNETVKGNIAIIGTVTDNLGMGGGTLSEAQDFYLEWGYGNNPDTWSNVGMDKKTSCYVPPCPPMIVDDTLAVWNTGVIPSGPYTIRLVATDGVDSNFVQRSVNVAHESIEVAAEGGKDYTSIQAAIDAAEMGDTVLVYAGNYNENLIMKATVTVMAKEDEVIITGQGSDYAVRIQDLAYPVTIIGLTIKKPAITSHSAIYVRNSSAILMDCIIKDSNGGNGIGGGALIVQNSNPKFYGCTFSNNESGDGGAVAIWGTDSYTPTASFVDCKFIGNQAQSGRGGCIWIQYETELDTTKSQPSFSNCEFTSNEAKYGGSAVWIDKCQRPYFTSCTFASNYIFGTFGGGVIDGYSSGGIFERCTWIANDCNGTSSLYLLDLPGFSGIARPIALENCLFSYNPKAIAVNSAHYDRYLVQKSNFYENKSGDDYWLTHGSDNLNENPAYCGRETEDYTLYSFSPCAPNVSKFLNPIGAYDVKCAPPCSISLIPEPIPPDTMLITCPQGDAGIFIASIDFKDSVMTRDIDSLEIELDRPYWHYRFFYPMEICADSAARETYEYKTTITHPFISGCGADSITVMLDDCGLEEKAYVRIRSPDFDKDGNVDLVDFSTFGESWAKCMGEDEYNECFDFDGDSCVYLNDFALFSLHWQHKYEDSLASMAAVVPSISDIDVKLIFREYTEGPSDRKLFAEVALYNIDGFKALIIAFENNNEQLEYIGWIPNQELPKEPPAALIHRDGMSLLFVGAFGMKLRGTPPLKLGTFEFNITGQEELDISENDFRLVMGNVLMSDGQTLSLRRLSREVEIIEIVYNNYLAPSYPNPFNPVTTIEYSIANDSHVNLSIYSVSGQLVRNLVSDFKKKNIYKVLWDGKNNNGDDVASGTYFCRLKTNEFKQTRKIILLR